MIWALAAVAFSSSFTGWIGSLLAGIGAFLGALLPLMYLSPSILRPKPNSLWAGSAEEKNFEQKLAKTAKVGGNGFFRRRRERIVFFANFACFCSNSSRYRARLTFLITLISLAILAFVITYLCPYLPLSLTWSLFFPDALSLAVASCLASALFRGLALRFPVMGIVEAGALVLFSARMLGLHRYDHLAQPFWMADYFAAHGITFNQYIGLGVFGLAAALLLFFSVLATTVRAASLSRTRFSWVSAIIGLAAFACLGAIAGVMLPMPSESTPMAVPQVAKSQATARTEQNRDNQADQSEPPLPPPPLPAVTGCVASIKFESDYRPPPRLGALYFRYQVFSRYARYSLVESGSNAMVSAGWMGPVDGLIQDGSAGTPRPTEIQKSFLGRAKPPAEPLVIRQSPMAISKKTVRTTVRLMQKLDLPLGLVAARQGRQVPPPDPRFVEAWVMESVCPGWSVLDLNDYEPADFLDSAWGDDEVNECLAGPDDPRLRELWGTICSNVTGEVSDLCMGKRVFLVRDWIVSNCNFSAQSSDPEQALPDFLFKGRRGGARQFALATALLCRAAGVPARVANGFCSRIARNDVGITREFQVGDRQAFAWAEVYLPGCGWIPVDSAPTPAALGAELAPAPIRFRNPIQLPHVLALGLVILLGYWFILTWRRSIRPLIGLMTRRHVYAYVAAIDLMALAGLRRRYGETREEFAGRAAGVCREAGYPRELGSCFEALTRMHLSMRREAAVHKCSDWLRELLGLGWAVTRCVKCQVFNPLCWINADNPLAGVHGHDTDQ
jgi:hypothetical protein